jgi:cytochrome c-type biogenesis protein CcmH/NrfF
MSPIWMIPVLVAVIGGLVVATLVRQTAESCRELLAEIARMGEVTETLVSVEVAARSLAAPVGARRRR